MRSSKRASHGRQSLNPHFDANGMNREKHSSDDSESRSNADSESRSNADGSSVSEANEPEAQPDSDPKVEDLYKSDVDRRLWAPAVDLDEEAEIQRKRLGRWIEAVRAAFRRWFSIR
jgi:hypothetical protein